MGAQVGAAEEQNPGCRLSSCTSSILKAWLVNSHQGGQAQRSERRAARPASRPAEWSVVVRGPGEAPVADFGCVGSNR